jgi:hypothetical protein
VAFVFVNLVFFGCCVFWFFACGSFIIRSFFSGFFGGLLFLRYGLFSFLFF